MKTRVTSSAIIYNAAAPEELFVEIKDGTYPVRRYRNTAVLVGGHREAEDRGPRDTFVREVVEELVLPPSDEDAAQLAGIVRDIQRLTVPYKTFLYTVEPSDEAKEGWREVMSILTTPLPKESWDVLVALQRKHGNLSAESFTAVASLKEIVDGAVVPCGEVAFALRSFYTALGISEGVRVPIGGSASVKEIGSGDESWDELLQTVG